MTTWRDVERVHKAHPEWNSVQIARELNCSDSYVRATGQRRGLKLAKKHHGGGRRPGSGRPPKWLHILVERIRKIALPGEHPHATIERILVAAELREAAHVAKTFPRYRDDRRERRSEERRRYLQTGAVD